jgi:ABC-2 type transport system ATP-binding protein
MSDAIITARGLTRTFDKTQALKGIDLEIARGEMFGLIGPDGAGKTTFFRIVAGLLAPTKGTLVRDAKATFGLVPQRFGLYQDLSIDENLALRARLYDVPHKEGLARATELLELVGLGPFRQRLAGALSGGMKQKLALCCALVHRPEILFLDEPTTGVDAVSRREFWDLLGTFKTSGMTILVSTPYMDEANRCDRVALIQAGRLLALDTPNAIAESFDRPLFAIRSSDRYRALKALRESPHTHSIYPFGQTLHYADKRTEPSPDQIAEQLRAFLSSRGFTDAVVERTTPTVEDSFIARMGAPEGARAA